MRLSKIIATIDGNKLTALDMMALNGGVPPRRLHEFWSWCFGKDFQRLKPHELMIRWNELHSDYMILMSHHSVKKSIQYMAAIWITK